MSEFNLFAKNEGPYMGISAEATLSFQVTETTKRTFRVLLYGAYNAYGLIGSESNGILVLDENHLRVLLDEHCKEQTGYFGPSERQLAEWERIVGLVEWKDFVEFVNSNNRKRYSLV